MLPATYTCKNGTISLQEFVKQMAYNIELFLLLLLELSLNSREMHKELSLNLLQVLQNALLKTKDISDISRHLYNTNVANFVKTSTN
jgi:hypothetical protein